MTERFLAAFITDALRGWKRGADVKTYAEAGMYQPLAGEGLVVTFDDGNVFHITVAKNTLPKIAKK